MNIALMQPYFSYILVLIPGISRLDVLMFNDIEEISEMQNQ